MASAFPCHATDAGDKSAVVRALSADADFVGLARHSSVADIDIVTARGEIRYRLKAQGDVATAGCAIERLNPSGRVGAAGLVDIERLITVGRVAEAGCIVEQCLRTHCRVEKGSCVVKERVSAVGRVQ